MTISMNAANISANTWRAVGAVKSSWKATIKSSFRKPCDLQIRYMRAMRIRHFTRVQTLLHVAPRDVVVNGAIGLQLFLCWIERLII